MPPHVYSCTSLGGRGKMFINRITGQHFKNDPARAQAMRLWVPLSGTYGCITPERGLFLVLGTHCRGP